MLQRAREQWPPDYTYVAQWRQQEIEKITLHPELAQGAREYYSTRPKQFISRWVDTVDPRNASKPGMLVRMPFVLFKRQRELVDFIVQMIRDEESGLVEKSRDMGATWLCAALCVWMWLYWEGTSIGWGSRKAMLVDNAGDMDSIFEKIRTIIRGLPWFLRPKGFGDQHMTHMKIINPENGATITGESGDDIGRGGRKRVYFKDESAHYERPEIIEAALADTTRTQIDISSVHGLGNVFHRRREAGVDWHPGMRTVRGKTHVFVMDWRDHPGKSQEWYDARRQKAMDDGLMHVFAQEVDRSYSASMAGAIIRHEWILSAIDAHLKLKMPEMESGPWSAALDVADEGLDVNALIARKGVVLRRAEEWGERDVGATTRRALGQLEGLGPVKVEYDCIGMGAAVKAEVNRLRDDKKLPRTIRMSAWDAGAVVQRKGERLIPNDDESPLVEDFFENQKAQAWWELARRFERTHRAVTEGLRYPASSLISIDSKLPLLRKLEKELAQPVMKKSGSMRLLVDKTPKGKKSPNLGDGTMMCYFPAETSGYDSSFNWL